MRLTLCAPCLFGLEGPLGNELRHMDMENVAPENGRVYFTGDESAWVGEITRDESGRVSAACLGGVEISGTALRSLFSLRSTAFTLEYTGGSFLFTVTGHGHGVGMSQHGANLMAAQGSDYTQILAHYYPGTLLVK